jgi:hypothetical protein
MGRSLTTELGSELERLTDASLTGERETGPLYAHVARRTIKTLQLYAADEETLLASVSSTSAELLAKAGFLEGLQALEAKLGQAYRLFEQTLDQLADAGQSPVTEHLRLQQLLACLQGTEADPSAPRGIGPGLPAKRFETLPVDLPSVRYLAKAAHSLAVWCEGGLLQPADWLRPWPAAANEPLRRAFPANEKACRTSLGRHLPAFEVMMLRAEVALDIAAELAAELATSQPHAGLSDWAKLRPRIDVSPAAEAATRLVDECRAYQRSLAEALEATRPDGTTIAVARLFAFCGAWRYAGPEPSDSTLFLDQLLGRDHVDAAETIKARNRPPSLADPWQEWRRVSPSQIREMLEDGLRPFEPLASKNHAAKHKGAVSTQFPIELQDWSELTLAVKEPMTVIAECNGSEVTLGEEDLRAMGLVSQNDWQWNNPGLVLWLLAASGGGEHGAKNVVYHFQAYRDKNPESHNRLRSQLGNLRKGLRQRFSAHDQSISLFGKCFLTCRFSVERRLAPWDQMPEGVSWSDVTLSVGADQLNITVGSKYDSEPFKLRSPYHARDELGLKIPKKNSEALSGWRLLHAWTEYDGPPIDLLPGPTPNQNDDTPNDCELAVAQLNYLLPVILPKLDPLKLDIHSKPPFAVVSTEDSL